VDTLTNSIELDEQKFYSFENQKTNKNGQSYRWLHLDSKGGTQQFRVQNQKQNLSPTFCAGTVHTDKCQCVVLSRLAFSATTIFATIGL